MRVAPGSCVKLPVASSHYSSNAIKNVYLQWRLGGIDSSGQLHQKIDCGSAPISFPHRTVAPAHEIELRMPAATMLCSLSIEACTAGGKSVASNFLHFFVSAGYPPAVEQAPRALTLRGIPGHWTKAEWSGESSNRDNETAEDACYGNGYGFFEWRLPLGTADLANARRLRVLCEASSHRLDTPQTDEDIWGTNFQITLNGIRVYEATLRNHPHDSRGGLSYLRGGKGAYGYLSHAIIEYRIAPTGRLKNH